MRIVVDTNIFVSAAIKESSWSAMVIRWVDRHGSLLKSIITEAEVMEVLQRPRFALLIPPLFLHNVQRMLAAAELVTITERVKECRDPKDDKFLELAWNGRAKVIVSGDADLLTLNPFRGIPIIDPATFGRSQVP
jgi:putative PIN family toxin of toxin-antitoxin system